MPRMPSHYCRAETKREYLTKKYKHKYQVWEDYAEAARKVDGKVCSITVFNKVFDSEFNIFLHQQKKDECNLCIEADLCPPIGSDLMRFEKHLEEREMARMQYELDSASAWTKSNDDQLSPSPRILVIETDLQKHILTPQANVGSFYYMRRLTNYNQTAYVHAHNKGILVLWHEGLLGKEGLCISTAIMEII